VSAKREQKQCLSRGQGGAVVVGVIVMCGGDQLMNDYDDKRQRQREVMDEKTAPSAHILSASRRVLCLF